MSFIYQWIFTGIILLIFTMLYSLSLKQLPNYRTNRLVLFAFPLLALSAAVLPQFQSALVPTAVIELPAFSVGAEPGVAGSGQNTTAESAGFWHLKNILIAVFAAGIAFSMWTTLRGLFKMLRLKNRGKTVQLHGINCIVNPDVNGTCSFFGIILVPDETVSKAVLQHEQAHVNEKHHLDLLWAELWCTALWFVPLISSYKRSVAYNHELEADQKAVEQTDRKKYSKEILSHSLGVRPELLTHSFYNYSFTKNRIIMLYKNQVSPLKAAMFYGLIVPVTAAAFFAVSSCNETEEEQSEKQQTEQELQSGNAQVKDGKKVYQNVEQMPEFPGGEQALFQYLSNQLQYPPEAKDQGLEGMVFVSFQVNKQGGIQAVEVVRGDEVFHDEAVRVVTQMPDWKPGKQDGEPVIVEFKLPIRFSLGKSNDQPE